MHATSTAVLIFLAILSVAASFAPTAPCLLPEKSQSMTHPRSSSSHDQHRLTAIHPKNIAASMMLVTGLLLSADPALAFQDGYLMQSTSLPHMLVAGRSGGRAGGRASPRPAARARAPAARAPSAVRSSTTIVRPMIVSPPVVVSPFGYGYGYGNPMGGFGLGYGLGAMNSAADSMRGE
jgi:hypothetical protein